MDLPSSFEGTQHGKQITLCYGGEKQMPEIKTKQRSSQRIECSNSCYLRYKGIEYRGVIENLSTSGALLNLSARQLLDIPRGSHCSLIISDDPQFIPGEFSGKIVHHHSSRIGIKFQF
jgi:hypothetical protein